MKPSSHSSPPHCARGLHIFTDEIGTEKAKKINTEKTEQTERGNAWKTLFSFVISVCSVFSVLKIFVIFAKIQLLID